MCTKRSVPYTHLDAYKRKVDVLVGSGVCAINGDARRVIQAGAISINGQKIHEDTEITDMSLVKKGKNTFVLVRS